MLSAKQSKASLFTCTLAWALMSGVVAPAWSAESEASGQASSQAATENSSSAGNQAASHTGYASNSLTQRNSLVGTPTVINRGNVGHEILQAAGQTRHKSTRTYSKKRTAHWKTQYWNGKTPANAKAAK
jgi:hypothetical protein